MVLKIFSSRVREARLAAGMTQTDLDAKLGLKPGCVAKWEAGMRLPQHDNLDKLAEVTGLPYAWFFDGAIPGVTGATQAARTLTKNVAKSTRGGASSQKLLRARALLQAAPAALLYPGRCDFPKSA